MLKKYTTILKRKLQEDPLFKQEIEILSTFYANKFLLTLNDAEQSLYYEKLEQHLNRQFLNGYMMFSEVINMNPDYFLKPEELTLDEIYHAVPINIGKIVAESKLNMVEIQTSAVFIIEILTVKGVAHSDLLNEIFEEITHYGACLAYVHHFKLQPKKATINLIDWSSVGRITPQVYMLPNGLDVTGTEMTFNLYGWNGSSKFKDVWLGRLQYSPHVKTAEHLHFELLLSDQINLNEKNLIIDVLHSMVLTTYSRVLNTTDNLNLLITLYNVSNTQLLSTQQS